MDGDNEQIAGSPARRAYMSATPHQLINFAQTCKTTSFIQNKNYIKYVHTFIKTQSFSSSETNPLGHNLIQMLFIKISLNWSSTLLIYSDNTII